MKNLFKSILIGLLIGSQAALAGLPPPSAQGQSGSKLNAKFDLQAPNNQITDLGGSKALIETGNKNLLPNASFENTSYASGWTITTVTGAVETTTVVDGKQSAKLTYTAQTGGISQSVTPSIQTNSVNYEASCKVNTTMTTIEVCGLTGGSNANCQAVPASGTWQTVTANFIGPANGTSVGVKVDTTASGTGTVYVDDCYVGPARNLGSGTFTTPWTSYTPTLTNSGTGSAIDVQSRRVGDSLEIHGWFTLGAGGNASAFQFGLPSGLTIDATKVTSTRIFGRFQFSTTSNTAYTAFGNGGNSYLNLGQWLNTANPYTALAGTGVSGTTWEIDVKGIPITQYTDQSFYRADSTPASWSGYQSGISGGCAANTTSFGDFSACTGITTTPITSRNITCTQSGTGPAISCTLARAGTHTICAYPSLTSSGSGVGSVQLTDGSNVLINPGIPYSVNANAVTGAVCGKYNATAAGATVFKLRGGVNTAVTFNIGSLGIAGTANVLWTVDEGDAPMGAPFNTGSITNGSKTQGFHHNAIQVTAQCNSGACTYTALDPSVVSSVTGNGTGGYTVTLASGECSTLPIWTVSSDNASTGDVCNPVQSGSTSTSLKVQCINAANGSGAIALWQLPYDCVH